MNSWQMLRALGYKPEYIPPDDNVKNTLIRANGYHLRDNYDKDLNKNPKLKEGEFNEGVFLD